MSLNLKVNVPAQGVTKIMRFVHFSHPPCTTCRCNCASTCGLACGTQSIRATALKAITHQLRPITQHPLSLLQPPLFICPSSHSFCCIVCACLCRFLYNLPHLHTSPRLFSLGCLCCDGWHAPHSTTVARWHYYTSLSHCSQTFPCSLVMDLVLISIIALFRFAETMSVHEVTKQIAEKTGLGGKSVVLRVCCLRRLSHIIVLLDTTSCHRFAKPLSPLLRRVTRTLSLPHSHWCARTQNR